MTTGMISPIFGLARGTRQGCSLSTSQFNTVLEPLVIAIRLDMKLKGVEGGGKEHELLLYADDNTF